VAVSDPREEARLRQATRLAVTGALGGIALAVSISPDVGGVLTLGCVGWLVWSLHRFGRLGPDAAV
jgi:predicted Rdx family selenoprotein